MPGPTREQLTAELQAVAGKLAEFLSVDEIATEIGAMVERIGKSMTDEEFDRYLDERPLAEEINAFGPRGPVGLGLGRYGGHAVGDDD